MRNKNPPIYQMIGYVERWSRPGNWEHPSLPSHAPRGATTDLEPSTVSLAIAVYVLGTGNRRANGKHVLGTAQDIAEVSYEIL